jgi:hypothetical protein
MESVSDTEKQLAKWFMSGEVGASSTAIAQPLSGEECDGDYPMDAGDLGRCIGLLDAVPEFRARLAEMAKVNRYWAALVPRWSELERCQSDYRKCSDLIRSLTRPVEKDDPSVVRLNEGCSIRFGGRKRP